MDWDKVIEILQSLPAETRAKKATMFVNDEYWFLDIAQSAVAGDVFVIVGRSDGDSGEESG